MVMTATMSSAPERMSTLTTRNHSRGGVLARTASTPGSGTVVLEKGLCSRNVSPDDGVLRQRASQSSVQPTQVVLLGRARRCVPPSDGFK